MIDETPKWLEEIEEKARKGRNLWLPVPPEVFRAALLAAEAHGYRRGVEEVRDAVQAQVIVSVEGTIGGHSCCMGRFVETVDALLDRKGE